MNVVLSLAVAILALAAVVIAVEQVRRSQRIAHGALLDSVLMYLYSEQARAARYAVFELEGKPFSEWSKTEILAAEDVGRAFNRIGFLMRNGYLRSDELLEWWGATAIATYRISTEMIESQRKREGFPTHFIYYEWLVRRALAKGEQRAWYYSRPWLKLKQKTRRLADLEDGYGTRGVTRVRKKPDALE